MKTEGLSPLDEAAEKETLCGVVTEGSVAFFESELDGSANSASASEFKREETDESDSTEGVLGFGTDGAVA